MALRLKTSQNRIFSHTQISGNVLIASNKSLTIYGFAIKSHDISKLRFIDFEESNISIELTFRPTQIAFAENYIACASNSTMHMFRIVTKAANSTQQVVDINGDFVFADDDTLDYKQLLKNETLYKEKITVNLASVLKENSVIHKYSPFTFCEREMGAVMKGEDSAPYCIENLIQLKIKPVLIENAAQNAQVIEEFKCMVVKPLYIEANLCSKETKKGVGFLRSNYTNLLHSVVCMIATQQEGYLYQFCDADVQANADNCIAIYPFTAPVYKLAMEDHLLHALTEVGLETYTLRTGHQLCRKLEVIDNVNTVGCFVTTKKTLLLIILCV